MNDTDKKIVKFYQEGCSKEKIARKIGRPGNIKRVNEALKRANIIGSKND